MQVEFVRNLHNNYGRIRLEEKPEDDRYQYCILNRGGIRGLLDSDLRYLDGEAYLYYDITSKQSLTQLYDVRTLNREWVRDFMWSLKQIRLELARFLLDERNILWYPGNVFQEMEDNVFAFLYVPYLKEENGFAKLLDFFVEHIDYEDTRLVEYIYTVYERYEKHGESYLQEKIFEDLAILDKKEALPEPAEETVEELKQNTPDAKESNRAQGIEATGRERFMGRERLTGVNLLAGKERQMGREQSADRDQLTGRDRTASTDPLTASQEEAPRRKGLRSLMESKVKKTKELKSSGIFVEASAAEGEQKVAEPVFYEESYGRTVYFEETAPEDKTCALYTPEGRLLAKVDRPTMTVGKKRGEVTLCLEDASVSRMHARILKEGEEVYIEDLNSTNGTFKNGLRMQPYEKKKLEEGDEIKCGKVVMEYR